MNEKAVLLTLRINAAIIAAILVCFGYVHYRIWLFDQEDERPSYQQQELLLKVDDLVKQGRTPGLGSMPAGALRYNLTLAKQKPPLTAEQRAYLELYLEGQEKSPGDVNPWDLKGTAIDFASRRPTGESVARFLVEIFVSYLPFFILLIFCAAKACLDTFRLWAFGARYTLSALSTREAAIIFIPLGLALCAAGYFTVNAMPGDQPLMIKQSAFVNPFLCLILISIYKTCLLTRVKDGKELGAPTWWFIY
jgi:hypothetical protein